MISGSRNKQKDMMKSHLVRVKADVLSRLSLCLQLKGSPQPRPLLAKPPWPAVLDNTGKAALGAIWGKGFQTLETRCNGALLLSRVSKIKSSGLTWAV